MDPRRRGFAAAGLAAVLLVACSDSRGAEETMPTLSTATTAAPTSAASSTSARSPSTPAPDTTDGGSSSTSAAEPTATTTSTTNGAGTTDAPQGTMDAPGTTGGGPPTSEPQGGGNDLVLRADGIGPYELGDAAGEVIDDVTQRFGEPDEDTGWLEPLAMAACTPGEYRSVSWGALSLLFTDESDVAEGGRHLFGYEYGRIGRPRAEPQGLATAADVTVGTTVGELRRIHPEAAVEGEIEGSQSAYFFITDGLQGLLSGTTDDDIVTFIAGGTACGL